LTSTPKRYGTLLDVPKQAPSRGQEKLKGSCQSPRWASPHGGCQCSDSDPNSSGSYR